jgi:hypothetical protein
LFKDSNLPFQIGSKEGMNENTACFFDLLPKDLNASSDDILKN